MFKYISQSITKTRSQYFVGQDLATVERKIHGYYIRKIYVNSMNFDESVMTLEYKYGRVNLYIDTEGYTKDHVERNKHNFKVVNITFG